MWDIEGTWEEVLARSAELAGRRVRVMVLEGAENGQGADLSPAERFASSLREAQELEQDMPLTPADDSVALVREARSGAMWGHEPEE